MLSQADLLILIGTRILNLLNDYAQRLKHRLRDPGIVGDLKYRIKGAHGIIGVTEKCQVCLEQFDYNCYPIEHISSGARIEVTWLYIHMMCFHGRLHSKDPNSLQRYLDMFPEFNSK